EGNGWSYHYARRQWSLVQNPDMKYDWLAAFDRAMTYLVNTRRLHCSGPAESLWIDNERKLLLFSRGGLLFAFNLHPTWSQENVFISCQTTGAGGYRAVLSTDEERFGGQNRVSMDYVYHAQETEYGLGFSLYLPCRCGVALEKVEG
ncbi:MAG: alpha amylase C-terminal domain-containing protein, partial [Clostridia bacterium]|nr:alpha amylase C-terminal domain-containing protein [Clostridia bacterium]